MQLKKKQIMDCKGLLRKSGSVHYFAKDLMRAKIRLFSDAVFPNLEIVISTASPEALLGKDAG